MCEPKTENFGVINCRCKDGCDCGNGYGCGCRGGKVNSALYRPRGPDGTIIPDVADSPFGRAMKPTKVASFELAVILFIIIAILVKYEMRVAALVIIALALAYQIASLVKLWKSYSNLMKVPRFWLTNVSIYLIILAALIGGGFRYACHVSAAFAIIALVMYLTYEIAKPSKLADDTAGVMVRAALYV